jgi:hypothetical protein
LDANDVKEKGSHSRFAEFATDFLAQTAGGGQQGCRCENEHDDWELTHKIEQRR